eukprot:6448386-Prymnesium_polylepis.1
MVAGARRREPPARRVRVGDGMNAPLTADSDSFAPLTLSGATHVPLPAPSCNGCGTCVAPLSVSGANESESA